MMTEAVAVLRAGGLVGLPTETVYGLAADAANPTAVAGIFAAKGRPADHPLIVHLAESSDLGQWAREIPVAAKKLSAAFWPGPLTLILKKQPGVSDQITGCQDTVGVRQPAHPMAQALLKQFGGALVAPSANRFGRISPTTAAAVREELGSAVSLILDGGMCQGGIESTIVDCSTADPVILRPGVISVTEIESVLGGPVQATGKNTPRVSGSHSQHYAPRTKAKLLTFTQIQSGLQQCRPEAFPLALVLLSTQWHITLPAVSVTLMPSGAREYAQILYQTLRTLDHQGFQSIWIESVPDHPEWAAVADRLKRATAVSSVS